MTNTFNDFVYSIKKDPEVRTKIYDMLDRYNKLPCNFNMKIVCDNLLQNVILRELINILGTVITDLDIDLKMKINRIKNLENKKHI